MYKLLAVALFMSVLNIENANAQKGIDKLIGAEKSFAAYAAQFNTRDAFLRYLDSADAVVFEDGKIVGAFAKWNKAVANTNKLIWQPAYAGIAQSGELGFTTGPWQFKHSVAESPLATGSFSTIWHLNDKGEWKFLVDIGTDGGLQAYPVDSVKKWIGTTIYDLDTRDALTIDRIFIQQYAALKNDAFRQW